MIDVATLYTAFGQCTGVTTDTRNCVPGSMFFALRGESFNGNAYAAHALEQGCAYAVIDDEAYLPPTDNDHYLLVPHALQALQALAHHHRLALGTRVIGITGTNGKTTTKELMAAVLMRKYNVLYTQGNFNNHIGVPLTLLRLRPEHELAVVEMGANHPGEIAELCEIAAPDYGIITNVGKAHLEGFGSFEGVIKTKGELYAYLHTKPEARIFIHHENQHLTDMADEPRCIAYGTTSGLYVSGRTVGCLPFLAFAWKRGADANEHLVETQLIGDYNLTNALAAVTVGCYFGVPHTQIDEALASYHPQNSRSQLVQTENNVLIVDAYNANPTSMRAAIENFAKMGATRKTLILGDMRELGEDSHAEHLQIVQLIGRLGFEDVNLVGECFAKCENTYHSYADVDALIGELKNRPLSGRTVLIKGSNGIKLNKVVEHL